MDPWSRLPPTPPPPDSPPPMPPERALYVGRCAPAVAVHLEPGGGFRNDGPRAVVLRRHLEVDASRAAFRVPVLDLRVGVDDAALLDGKAQLIGGLPPRRVRRRLAFSRPRGFRGPGDLLLHLGVDAHPLDRRSLFHQAGALVPGGPVNGRVVIELAPLDQTGPGLLTFVESLVLRQLAGLVRPGPRQGEHLVLAALRSRGLVLAHRSVLDPAIDGPPSCVGMSAEAGVGQVAERDRAIHPHVGQGPLGAVLETLPLLVARVVFP